MMSHATDIQTPRVHRETKDLARAAVSGWLGTGLEYLDFQLYALAAALVFGDVFFPEATPAVALISSFATLGVGYIARPLGALFFGRMGDRIGRTHVLYVTISMMGIATTLIGFLPTYAQVGVLAPALLVLLRLVQGFGAGAELAGASVMLAEYAPPPRRGIIASLVCLGTNTGTLIASGLWALLLLMPDEAFITWGWRVPFIGSVLILVFTLWLRRNLKESPVFEEIQIEEALTEEPSQQNLPEAGERVQKEPSLVSVARGSWRAFLLGLGLRLGESGTSAIYQIFLVGYIATTLGLGRSVGTNAILIGSVLGFLTVPLFGFLSDRFGRRICYRALAGFQILFAFPSVMMIQSGNTVAITVSIVIGLSISVLGMYSVQSAYLVELFGSRSRYTLLAVCKEIGGILAAGIVAIIISAILAAVPGGWYWIAIIMIAYASFAFAASLLSPETAGRDLTVPEDAL